MANEAVLLTELEHPISFTVDNTTAITKGTLCKLADPMTASISTVRGDVLAGIAASDKIASDGVTELGMIRRGIFKMIISGSVTVGDPLIATHTTAAPNYVESAVNEAALSGSRILGTALETGTNGETIKVLVDISHGNGV